jgi:hypothetical protein
MIVTARRCRAQKGSAMNPTGSSRLAVLAAVMALTSAAIAADPSIRKKGEPATFTGSSFGELVTKLGDDDTVVGTFDSGGKLRVKGNMDNPTYVGFWTADTAPKECDNERDGTSYWGKVKFEMSDAGRTYTGKWSYCDAEPDVAFQAKWDGK